MVFKDLGEYLDAAMRTGRRGYRPLGPQVLWAACTRVEPSESGALSQLSHPSTPPHFPAKCSRQIRSNLPRTVK